MDIIIIAALASNNVIGNGSKIPWRLSDDFKHFKKTTEGSHIIMGRKTFESLPGLLPNRTHIVITRSKTWEPTHRPTGVPTIVLSSLEAAIQYSENKKQEKVFIIGGGEIYKEALPLANKMILTHVHAKPEGDIFFPVVDPKGLDNVNRHYCPPKG